MSFVNTEQLKILKEEKRKKFDFCNDDTIVLYILYCTVRIYLT